MKAVFDSNVYLAATKQNSYTNIQLQRFHPDGSLELFISPNILTEVRTKIETKLGYDRVFSAHFAKLILQHASLIHPTEAVSGVLQDTDDHIILECALEANAHSIVTADRQMLKLKRFRDIAIIHPTMLQYLQ